MRHFLLCQNQVAKVVESNNRAIETTRKFYILKIILLVQLKVNLLNDHDDFINHVDTKKSHGSNGVVVEGLLSLKEVYKSGMMLLVLVCLIGLFLSYKRGPIILTFGIIGAICG